MECHLLDVAYCEIQVVTLENLREHEIRTIDHQCPATRKPITIARSNTTTTHSHSISKANVFAIGKTCSRRHVRCEYYARKPFGSENRCDCTRWNVIPICDYTTREFIPCKHWKYRILMSVYELWKGIHDMCSKARPGSYLFQSNDRLILVTDCKRERHDLPSCQSRSLRQADVLNLHTHSKRQLLDKPQRNLVSLLPLSSFSSDHDKVSGAS